MRMISLIAGSITLQDKKGFEYLVIYEDNSFEHMIIIGKEKIVIERGESKGGESL